MANKPNSSLALLLLLLTFPHADATIGLFISNAATHLVAPAVIAQLLKSHGIGMVRLFSPNPAMLIALKDTGIKAMVAVTNDNIIPLSVGGADAAAHWLKTNILAYMSGKQLSHIAVGNDVLKDPLVVPHLMPAMENLHKALQMLGLDSGVKVSSPCPASVLGVMMPPSKGAFAPLSLSVLQPMLKFLKNTGSPIMMNMDPFQTFLQNPLKAGLDFFLFQGKAPSVPDSGLSYTNILDATMDAMVAATEKQGFSGISVMVTETGWPKAGNHTAASMANAAAFVGGIVGRALNGTGTPKRPNQTMQVFLSDMFNDNKKGGANLGIFNPDGSPACNIDFNNPLCTGPIALAINMCHSQEMDQLW